jgi:hypothetical protein
MSEPTSSVTFRAPDFTDEDGIFYSDIEVIVEMDSSDIRSTVKLAQTLERIGERDGRSRSSQRS